MGSEEIRPTACLPPDPPITPPAGEAGVIRGCLPSGTRHRFASDADQPAEDGQLWCLTVSSGTRPHGCCKKPISLRISSWHGSKQDDPPQGNIESPGDAGMFGRVGDVTQVRLDVDPIMELHLVVPGEDRLAAAKLGRPEVVVREEVGTGLGVRVHDPIGQTETAGILVASGNETEVGEADSEVALGLRNIRVGRPELYPVD